MLSCTCARVLCGNMWAGARAHVPMGRQSRTVSSLSHPLLFSFVPGFPATSGAKLVASKPNGDPVSATHSAEIRSMHGHNLNFAYILGL